MKTSFQKLKQILEEMGDEELLLDHDLNIMFLRPKFKELVLQNLDIENRSDVSRFLTFVICLSEGDGIDDEMVNWTEEEYAQYLKTAGIDEELDNESIDNFLGIL
ncbi:MAG: hypothetical protein ACLGHN_10870 [Bacteriovoracia bacterium]